MASKRRNLYLYLTLVCFFGLIAIFIVDGYMGVYDTIYITSGEYEQKVESDVWRYGESYWSSGVNRGGKAFFGYEVDNRQFSSYAADVEVSVWQMQEKVLDVTSQQLVVGSFEKGKLEWAVDSNVLVPSDAPAEQLFEYTVKIKRDSIERNVILYINPVPYTPKPVPVPPEEIEKRRLQEGG